MTVIPYTEDKHSVAKLIAANRVKADDIATALSHELSFAKRMCKRYAGNPEKREVYIKWQVKYKTLQNIVDLAMCIKN